MHLSQERRTDLSCEFGLSRAGVPHLFDDVADSITGHTLGNAGLADGDTGVG